MDFLIVGVCGFFGSILRYVLYSFEKNYDHLFPYATLVINTLGCFVAGLLITLAAKALPQHRAYFMLGSIGFIGAFTTFSTFSAETFQLIRSQQILMAIGNVLLSVVLGLLAVWAGTKIVE